MKIGIIAFGYVPSETGGTETYFRNLLKGISRYDKKNKYTLIVNKKYLNEAKKSTTPKGMKIIGMSILPPFHKRVLRKFKLISKDNEALLVAKINKLDFDLVHFPFQVIFPFGLRARKVLTFMDMQERHFPEFFSKTELGFRENNYRRSVEESDAVICISDFTKSDILRYYESSYSKKCTTVLITDGEVKNSEISFNKYKNYMPYFYYPAATWPHKNHSRLIKAFAEVSKKYPEYSLLLTGLNRQKSRSITILINKLQLSDKVINLGYLPYDEKEGVFRGAFALVFPSLFEGFGIPVLESMRMGVPVLCSNSSSLPEVGGNAVLYFSPKSIKQMKSKMLLLIEDSNLKRNLIKRGLIQSKKFSLKKMTDETIAVYNKVYHEK